VLQDGRAQAFHDLPAPGSSEARPSHR
jgi:hypothetical protein